MPIVHVSPLGSSASDVGAAINQIIDYLQRGTKLAQANSSPTVGYYADSAEGPGVWRGRGVGSHQLTGAVDPDMLREVLSGRHPATGQQLVMATGSAGRAQRERPNVDVATNGPPDELLSTEQVAALLGTSEQYVRKLALDTQAATNPQTPVEAATYRRARLQGIQLDTGAWAFRRDDVERFAAHREAPKVVVAYDVTVSVEKSISLAWVHAKPEQRHAIERSIDNGVNAAVSYLEEHALNVRRGRGSEQADGVWAASYRHLTNRHLEPQFHEHILIANVAAPVIGGATQAIDARGLMHHAKTAGYVAGAVIRNELSQTLGLEWQPVTQGLADLAGIPRTAIDAMSTRRKEIESVAAELGLDSRHARQYAALSTRRAKQEPTDWLQLETDWQTKLDTHGFTRTDWLQLTNHNRRNIAAPTPRDIAALNDWLDSPDGITRRNAIFTRRDVVQHIIDHDATNGSNRLTLDAIETLTERFLASNTVLTVDVPAAQRSRTGENVWYTTVATLQLEQSVINTYRDGLGQLVAAVPADPIQAAIKQWETNTGHTLGDDQQAMVSTICATPDRFTIVVGPAGTGKTSALEVAARAWESAGYRPLGISVTGAATDQLAAATGIETRTVASLIDALDNGYLPLDARTVLVVDEASTLSNRDHHAIINAVTHAGARMVTIGDPAQHAAVDAGGLWAHLVDTLADRLSRLDINRRQASEPMTDVRLANADYREGRIAAALARLETGERIVSAPTALQLLDDLATDWYLDRQTQHVDGGPVSRMMAEQHSIRRQLNDRAQTLLIADGTLVGDGVRIGEATFHVGDEVVTRTRDRWLKFDHSKKPLRNSTLGTVTGIGNDLDGQPTLTVDFGSRGTLMLDHEFLTRPIRPGVTGGLTPAYAVTTHVAQGSTYTAGRMIASDTSSRAGIYVGLTRGTSDANLYVVRRRDLEPQERSDVGLPTITDTRTAIDALADQLAKPGEVTVVTAADPAAQRILELSKLRLTELRPLADADSDVRRAIDLIGERIAKRTIANPTASVTDRFGMRPPIHDAQRPVWDQTIRALTIYQTRYGTSQLPANATVRQANEHANLSRFIGRLGVGRQPANDLKAITADLANARRQLPVDDATIQRLQTRLKPLVTAAVENPAAYLTDLLGQRPEANNRQATWDRAATHIEQWRHEHGITPTDIVDDEQNTTLGRAIGIKPQNDVDQMRFDVVESAIQEHTDVQKQVVSRGLRP